MKVTANATRTGDWWAVEVPEIDGLFTQTKRLDQIPEMVADAAALLEDVDPADVEVDVVAALGNEADRDVTRVVDERVKLDGLQATLAAEVRDVASKLTRAQGLSTRDAGSLLGISHQRISQLLGDEEPALAGKSGGNIGSTKKRKRVVKTRSATTGRIVTKTTTTTRSGKTTSTERVVANANRQRRGGS